MKGDYSIPIVRRKNVYEVELKKYEEILKIGGQYHGKAQN